MVTNMVRATLVLRERFAIEDDLKVEIVIWQLPRMLPGSAHAFKYRLALVADDVCVLRYDNESGKGDHKHIGETEAPYSFTTLADLQCDFWRDVAEWRTNR